MQPQWEPPPQDFHAQLPVVAEQDPRWEDHPELFDPAMGQNEEGWEGVIHSDSMSQAGAREYDENPEGLGPEAFGVFTTYARQATSHPQAPRSSAGRPRWGEEDERSVAPRSIHGESRQGTVYDEEDGRENGEGYDEEDDKGDAEYREEYAATVISSSTQRITGGRHAPRSSSGRPSSQGRKATSVAGTNKSK